MLDHLKRGKGEILPIVTIPGSSASIFIFRQQCNIITVFYFSHGISVDTMVFSMGMWLVLGSPPCGETMGMWLVHALGFTLRGDGG